MIGPIQAATAYHPATTISTTTASKSTEPGSQANANITDKVQISSTGQAMSKGLETLPQHFLDPAWHQANAEKDLPALLKQLGITASTKLDIQSNNDGTFVVTSDNAKAAAEVERMLNDGTALDLRNDLIGLESALKINQIGAAVSKAMQQADANPAMTDAIYARLPAIAAQITAQDFSFTYDKQQASYTLA